MKKRVHISEIMEEFKTLKTKQERIECLKKHDSKHLRMFLFYSLMDFTPVLSKKDVESIPYSKHPVDHSTSVNNLFRMAKRYHLFFKETGNWNRNRALKFLNLNIPDMEYYEAKYLKDLVSGNVKVNFLTKNLVNEIFDGMLETGEEN